MASVETRRTGNDERVVSTLAKGATGEAPWRIDSLRAHASSRKIFRLFLDAGRTAVAIVNDDIQENQAFIGFSKAFRGIGLPVPEITASNGWDAYIETDLGDRTLMDELAAERSPAGVGARVEAFYRQALDDLIVFQTQGLRAIDVRLCYQGARFDPLAVAHDLESFADEYLKRVGLPTDGLARDFEELGHHSDRYDRGYFMFRDFQSRNIMVHDERLWYIDYQSGREGPLQYDVASLLFQSQADLPFALREQLLEHYMERLAQIVPVDRERFRGDYLVYVLIRALQNLGVYGKLGLGQQKEYFRNAIPFALRNCGYLLEHWPDALDCGRLRERIALAVRHGA